MIGQNIKTSPKIEEKALFTNLLKAHKSGSKGISQKNSKRSRGSQDKYSAVISSNA
jgi:hypothetical protein